MNTLEFERSLSGGDYVSPIAQHIVFQHSLLYYHAGVRGHALLAAEHSLREMYVATAQYRGPYRELAPAALEADWAKSMGAAIKQAAANIRETMGRARQARNQRAAALTPEQRDAVSQRRLDRLIEAERAAGLAFVKREAKRIKREMGLS